MDPNKPFCIIDLESCDYITSVECIVRTGETIPPILLISGVHKWCQLSNLDGNIVIGKTETSYANNDILLE